VTAGTDEVGVEGVERPRLDCPVGGHHALGGDETAEEAPLALAGVAQEEVLVKLVEFEVLEEGGELATLFDGHRATHSMRCGRRGLED
jgi:hypothetical protein